MTSTKNPIVIMKNRKKAAIKELKLEIIRDFQILQVTSLDGKTILAKQNIVSEPFLSLDSELGSVKLVYLSTEGKFIDEEVMNLTIDNDDSEFYTEEELNYRTLKDFIAEQMDNPTGSEKEKSEHTRLLKETSIYQHARDYVFSRIRRYLIDRENVNHEDVDNLAYRLYSDLYGLGAIQELDDNEEIGEIMVNARVFPHFQADIYFIKRGKKEKYEEKSFNNLEELKNTFDRVIAFNKKAINSVETAIVEATRPNRDRVNIIVPDASENYILNIRKFTNFVPNKEMMKESGTVDNFIERLMDIIVRGKANIGIGGPMGTGKTTYVNYLLTYTAPIERKVIIAAVAETDAERVLAGHDVVIFNVDEEKGFTFEKLVRTSLRTTADRVIIPESRGGEFKQLYEANLKTKGNMFTGHALDDDSFLEACVDMYMSSPDAGKESSTDIRNKLTKGIDIIIIMRLVGNKIRIKCISEIMANEKGEYIGMNCLYKWDFDPEKPLEGQYIRTNNRMTSALKGRLNEFGIPMSEMEDL